MKKGGVRYSETHVVSPRWIRKNRHKHDPEIHGRKQGKIMEILLMPVPQPENG